MLCHSDINDTPLYIIKSRRQIVFGLSIWTLLIISMYLHGKVQATLHTAVKCVNHPTSSDVPDDCFDCVLKVWWFLIIFILSNSKTYIEDL